VHLPLTFRMRGGRKLMVTPDGAPSLRVLDRALVKGARAGVPLARAAELGV
jgi:hypothetical protein